MTWVKQHIRRYWADTTALTVLVAAVCGLLWRFVLLGETLLPLDLVAHFPPWRYSYERTPILNPIPSDVSLEYYPRRLIATRMLRDGQLPLWNPYILAGVPLLADGYSALLYPLSMLFVVLPVGMAYGWFTLLHLVMAAWGAYWFARVLRQPPWSAGLAGLVFVGSGFALTWLHFTEFVAVLGLFPWAMGAVERFEQAAARGQGRQQLRWALLIAALLAGCVLCQLQLALYAGVGVVAFWGLRRLLARPQSIATLSAPMLGVAGLALLLSAAQWLPSVELVRESQRAGFATQAASPIHPLGFLLPTVFGMQRTAGGWGSPYVAFLMPYVGLLPLALAVMGAWRSRTPAIRALLVLTILSILAAMLPTHILVRVPLLNQLPGIDRWTLVSSLGLAQLAAAGLASFAAAPAPPTRRWRWFGPVVTGGVLGVAAVAVLQHLQLWTPQSRYGGYVTLLRPHLLAWPLLMGLSSAVLMLGLILAGRFARPHLRRMMPLLASVALLVAGGDLAWYALPMVSSGDPQRLFQPTSDLLAAIGGRGAYDAALTGDVVYPPTRMSHLLAQDRTLYRVLGADYPSLQPNTFGVFGAQDVRGYASVFSRRYLRLIRRWEDKPPDEVGGLRVYLGHAYRAQHLLDLFGVRYVVFNPQSDTEEAYTGLQLIERNDEGALFRNPTALDRAFLVHQAEVLPNVRAILDRLVTPGFPVSTTALLRHAPPPLAMPPVGAVERVEITKYTPLQVEMLVEAHAPGLLVMSDSMYPGWHATLDGRPTRIHHVHTVLRGVAIPAGRHRVVFRYRPMSFMVGAPGSLVGWLGWSGGLWWVWRTKRPR